MQMNDEVLSHWYQRFDNLSYSSNTFYEQLYEEIARRQIPDVKLFRHNYAEKSLLSSKREYFIAQRGPHRFIVCAAPFGIDFFVSWWLLDSPGCATGCLTAMIPFARVLTDRRTFYEEDTATIFRDVTHEAVLATIDAIYSGDPKKPEFDRNPTSRSRKL
jgi:hypothetical protein